PNSDSSVWTRTWRCMRGTASTTQLTSPVCGRVRGGSLSHQHGLQSRARIAPGGQVLHRVDRQFMTVAHAQLAEQGGQVDADRGLGKLQLRRDFAVFQTSRHQRYQLTFAPREIYCARLQEITDQGLFEKHLALCHLLQGGDHALDVLALFQDAPHTE